MRVIDMHPKPGSIRRQKVAVSVEDATPDGAKLFRTPHSMLEILDLLLDRRGVEQLHLAQANQADDQ